MHPAKPSLVKTLLQVPASETNYGRIRQLHSENAPERENGGQFIGEIVSVIAFR